MIPDEINAQNIANIVFEVIWDTKNRKKGEQSQYRLLDPTINEEHARQLAAAIGEQLDSDGWM